MITIEIDATLVRDLVRFGALFAPVWPVSGWQVGVVIVCFPSSRSRSDAIPADSIVRGGSEIFCKGWTGPQGLKLPAV